MFCPRWDKDIFRWLNGRLESRKEARLLGHMERCERCRNTAARFGKVREILGQETEPDIPESLTRTIEERVRARIRGGEAAPDPVIPPRTRMAPAFACMCVGVAIGAFIGWSLIESSVEGRGERAVDWVSLTGVERVAADPVAEILWPVNGRGDGR